MRRLPFFAVLLLTLVIAGPAAPVRGAVDLPAKLSDTEFWRLVGDLSEPDGTFRSENLISNEMVLPRLLPEVIARTKPGGVYIGVGPEQNFSYLAAMKPQIAFITDIRRGNLHVLLMYKALFELSANRGEFVARLFTKPRPSNVTTSSTSTELMSAFWASDTADEAAYTANLAAIHRHLTKTRSIPLPQEDLDGIARAYRAFYWYGPAINYSATTALSNLGGGRSATYWDLMTQVDADGKGLSYLASEEKFRFIKDMYSRNMIVPLVGNFSGPKTIRAIGEWVRERGAIVSVFYVSTVEPYLKRDGSFPTFCASVATLPTNEQSIFIRPGNVGGQPTGAFSVVVPGANGDRTYAVTAVSDKTRPTTPAVNGIPVAGQAVGQYVTGMVVPIQGGCS